MTMSEIARAALDLLNQENTNHGFGSDQTRLYRYVNLAYIGIARTAKCIRLWSEITTDGSAGYDLDDLFDDSFIADYHIVQAVDPANELPLDYVDPGSYKYMNKGAAGRIWGWTEVETPLGQDKDPSRSRYIYIIDTPGSGLTVPVEAWIVPVTMDTSAGTDVPLIQVKDHQLLAEVAAKIFKASELGVFYDVKQDSAVRSIGAVIVNRRANVDTRKKFSLDKYRNYRARDYKL